MEFHKTKTVIYSRYKKEILYLKRQGKTHGNPDSLQEGLLPYVSVGNVLAPYSGDEYFEPYEVTKGGTYYDDSCEVPPGQNYKALTALGGLS